MAPTWRCIQKIKEAPCYFLETAPFSFFFSPQPPMLIKGVELRANAITCPLRPPPLTCVRPASFSLSSTLLALILSFSAWRQGSGSSPLVLFCLYFAICSLPLFLSAVTQPVSRWRSPYWKNPSQWVHGKIARATDAHVAFPFPFITLQLALFFFFFLFSPATVKPFSCPKTSSTAVQLRSYVFPPEAKQRTCTCLVSAMTFFFFNHKLINSRHTVWKILPPWNVCVRSPCLHCVNSGHV